MVLAVFLAWVVLVGLQLAFTISHVRAGEAAVTEALRAATGADGVDDFARAMERARHEFARARAGAANRLMAPVRVMPVAGRQLGSLAALSRTAEQAAGVGATAATALDEVLGAEEQGGPARLASLRRLGEILQQAEKGLTGLDLGPSDHLVPPLAEARDRFASRLTEGVTALRDGASVTGTVAELLAGPRRYLLLAANNSEMRAGSGMFLSAGMLETADGELTLGPMEPTADLALPGEGVGLEADLAGRWGWLHPGREWRNLGLSPRFDVTGRLAADMWLVGGRPSVDGVLAIDVEVVRGVLAATGPVQVNGSPMGAGEVVEHLLHGQYVGLGHEGGQEARREQLGDLAAAALLAVQSRSYDLGRLASALGHAARGRHLLAWSVDPEEQRVWETAGISGALSPDSLSVAVLNRGGNKLDRFLGVSPDLTLRPTSTGTDVTVDVQLENATPPGEPRYVAGPHPDTELAPGDYLGIVSVNVPGSAVDVRVDGDPPLVADGPDGGTWVIATPVLLPAGTRASVVVRFRLPAEARNLHVVASGRVPAVDWRMGDLQWADETRRTIGW